MILEKGLVRLRPVDKDDITLRIKYNINASYAKMIGLSKDRVGKFTKEDGYTWYKRVKEHPCKWVIDYDNHFVGCVSLRPELADNKGRFAIELYDESVYNKGIGRLATELVLDYAFTVKKYHKVYLRALDYNHRAIHLYEKVGFVQEGVDREGACIDGDYYSDVYMGLLRKTYLERK